MTPKEWRKKKNLTLSEAAALLGVSRGHVSNIENGTRVPSLAIAKRYQEVSKGRIKLTDFPSVAA